MIQLVINKLDIAPLLAGTPTINDQMEAACRVLEFKLKESDRLQNYQGQRVEFRVNGKRWYVGFMRRKAVTHEGVITYTAYDPLIFLVKNTDDFTFKKNTATQAIKSLAASSGVRVYKLANTGAVLPTTYYQGAAADKVTIDQLVRTYNANKKRFWFRYRPDDDGEGLHLFERVVPAQLWAFQVGVNLVSASYEESIEDTVTVVKLVNRDTGKVVTRVDSVKLKAYGKNVHFEEVDKDATASMDTLAKDKLAQLGKLAITQQMEGINPDCTMPQFFSGDFIYVEEKYTHILGGYHIRNITQAFESSGLVKISADIEADAFVPDVQFSDATKNPKASSSGDGSGTGVQQEYSPEVNEVMKQYGLE